MKRIAARWPDSVNIVSPSACQIVWSRADDLSTSRYALATAGAGGLDKPVGAPRLADRCSGRRREGVQAATGKDIGLAAHALANVRLDPLQRVKLRRSLASLWRHRKLVTPLRPYHLVALSNRTLSFLADEMEVQAPARKLLVKVSQGEYGSAMSIGLGRGTLALNEPADGVLLFLDHGAFSLPARLLDLEEEQRYLDEAIALMRTMVGNLRARFEAPVIVATVALPPELLISSADRAVPGSPARFIERLNAAILDGGFRKDWLVWDVSQLANEIGTQTWFDPVRFHQTKAPFSLALCATAADHFFRMIAALVGKSGRALVLDLDNTLWGGVVADDGLAGIDIGQGSVVGEAHLAFQRTLLEARSRGVVLSVCSKNTDAIAREPFVAHPEMALKLDHIAVFQADWTDKATNVQAIAGQLNLGVESLVFIDDNPAERLRVRSEHAVLAVPEMGDDPAYFPRLLAASGVIDQLVPTAEDLGRADSYQTNAHRAEILARVGNYDEYLATLQMVMSIAPFDQTGRTRIAQLISKSNQFNLTSRRYSETDVAALAADRNILAWQVSLRDKFSKHGMICAIIVRKAPKTWMIDTWLMSCRVLERGVEQTLMNTLVAAAGRAGVEEIHGLYRPTDRNLLVADFFDKMQFVRPAEKGEDGISYMLPVKNYSPFKTFIEIAGLNDAKNCAA